MATASKCPVCGKTAILYDSPSQTLKDGVKPVCQKCIDKIIKDIKK